MCISNLGRGVATAISPVGAMLGLGGKKKKTSVGTTVPQATPPLFGASPSGGY